MGAIATLDREPATLNIRVRQGDDFRDVWVFTDDDEVTPIDITGWVFKAEVRRRPGALKATTIQGTVIDGPKGQLSVSTPATDTKQMLGTYWYDAEIDDPSTGIRTLLSGVFYVSAEVTS
jgi:hypothetical protein